ncbi:MAG: hypothetical protein V7K98_08670 [Nostoc sp.]
MGNRGEVVVSLSPMPHAQCPMPNSLRLNLPKCDRHFLASVK